MKNIAGFVNDLVQKLFEPEERRLTGMVDVLVDKHVEASGRQGQSFLYNGIRYMHSRAQIIDRIPPMLAWSLNGDMERMLKDRKMIDLDKATIRQTLFKVLECCPDTNSVRDYIPDCFIPFIPEFSGVARTVSVEALIQHNQMLLRQYTKALPKMQFYSVTYLIY